MPAANVVEWLSSLGLSCYEHTFADHDVDAETLPLLTAADLTSMGITSVGHRRKLLAAIEAWVPDAAEREAPAAAQAHEAMAEHRQITVLNCDLVGSTALSDRLDPEEMRDVVRAFHDLGTRIVGEYEGLVANFIGDCVLAYFGWPRAHEDDAERALRAGLALAAAVRDLRTALSGELEVRVGIATGPVVVGDLVASGPAREHSAVGTAPQIAAALQGLAAPGQVVIDALTHRLLEADYAVQPVPGPIEAYAIGAEQLASSRFEARRDRTWTPMVGRERELDLLRERWAQARACEGLAVMLVGEAGIGKSRIVHALLDEVAPLGCRVVRWQCSPYHVGRALWPVIQAVRREAGLHEDDAPDDALDKMERLVGPDPAIAGVYAALLGLDGGRRYGSMDLTPQQLRERTIDVLADQLHGAARRQSLLWVVEDAHWIDATTLDLIERSLERIDPSRTLLVITTRPEQQPELATHPSVSRVWLNRLTRAAAESLVSRLGGDALEPEVVAAIVAQTDGVPLLVEELTKAVLETGVGAIPASLQGWLMARLDRVPAVKSVAQRAACIGRDFDQELIEAVSADPPDQVSAALEQLVGAGIVFRRGDGPRARYTFRHALVQESAAGSLLRGERQRIHARLFHVLSQRPHTPPEILALHAERASEFDAALAWRQKAAEAALGKSAFVEATGHIAAAIELSKHLPDSPQRHAREIALQLDLGQAYIALHGFGADLSKQAFQRAADLLASAPPDPTATLRALYGLWACHLTRAELDDALKIAQQAHASAQHHGIDDLLLYAYRMEAGSHMHMGQLHQAHALFDRAMPLTASTRRRELMVQFGVDPALAVLCYRAWTCTLQDLGAESQDLRRRAAASVASTPLALARAQVHLVSGLIAACTDDVAAATEHAHALRDLAATHRLAMYAAQAGLLLAWIEVAAPQPAADAVERCRAIVLQHSRLETRIWLPFVHARLALALARTQAGVEAVAMIDHALDECTQTRQGWCHAEVWRCRGLIHLEVHGAHTDEAARCFQHAVALAQRQGATLWAGRAALDLARLRMARGDASGARAVLQAVLAPLPPGFSSPQTAEVRRMLGAVHEECS